MKIHLVIFKLVRIEALQTDEKLSYFSLVRALLSFCILSHQFKEGVIADAIDLLFTLLAH